MDHNRFGEESMFTGEDRIGPPAAAGWGVGRVDVFWRASSGGLGQAFYDGSWQVVQAPLAFDLAGNPAVCSWGSGRLDVLWRDSSGSLIHLWHDGQGWHGPESLGRPPTGGFVGDPACCSWAPGVLDVFVRGADNSVWHRWYDDGWHDWYQREGRIAASPGVASWADGRIDLFAAGTDDRLRHGSYQGQPVATKTAYVKHYWQFLDSYHLADRALLVRMSFAAGSLISEGGGCSGMMISPHLFMTASHCGGPGWTGTVNFFHRDHFDRPADDRNQVLSPGYPGRTLPWQDSGIGGGGILHGDTCLWWLPDGADGVAPGIRYGFAELSPDPVAVGTLAYSFWSNPAVRLPDTLLFSSGRATALHPHPADDDFRGSWTDYAMWSDHGASGSGNVAADHGHRVVGVTQGGAGGVERSVVDTSAFLSRWDVDGDQVADPVDYDWLFTQPSQPVHFLGFRTPFDLSRWVALPGGSATAVGKWQRLSGFPEMRVQPDAPLAAEDGYWNHFARFSAGATLRMTVEASGRNIGRPVDDAAAYLKFRSDSSGDETYFRFQPETSLNRWTGKITLGPHADYRLIIGTKAGTSLHIEAIVIVDDGQPFGFRTHDERRSWMYSEDSGPMAWGVRASTDFSGAVVGPTPQGWGLMNRHLGLPRNNLVTVNLDYVVRSGTAQGMYVRFVAPDRSVVSEHVWSASTAVIGRESFTGRTGPDAPTLIFGAESRTDYCIADLNFT